MGSIHKDYYRVLELPSSAQADEIKKRYRELARRYHPDINHSPEAARKIQEINEAYHVLGDEDRRAVYDSERLPAKRTGTTGSASHPASSRPASAGHSSAAPHPPPHRPTDSAEKMDFNGFGRAAAENRQPYTARPTPVPDPGMQDLRADKLYQEAKIAFLSRHFKDAERLCRKAIGLNSRNASAHELMGDILIKRGAKENAAASYSYSIQFNPSNLSAQAKLERLSDRRRHGPIDASASRSFSLADLLQEPNRDATLGAISLVMLVLLSSLLLFIHLSPGHPVFLGISVHLLLALLLIGLFSGTGLALYGGLNPFSRELTIHTRRGRRYMLGAPLALCSMFLFYASALMYLLIITVLRRPSRSLLQVYGATMALSAIVWLVYPHAGIMGPEVLLLAGNFLFPGMLAGWKVGDSLRLPAPGK